VIEALNEKWGLGVEGYSEIEDLPMLGPSTTRRIVSVPSLIINSPTPREGPSGRLLTASCSD
jgi:hypothetical protein